MKRSQRIVRKDGVTTFEAEILAGPWEWEIGTYSFKTVLVRTKDRKIPRELSVIDVRSGRRLGTIMCASPKSRAYEALHITAALLYSLREQYGDEALVRHIKSAPPLDS